MSLDALLRPRSIAVVGASDKPSLGRWMLESLKAIGIAGTILPVNPNYREVAGLPCHPSLADLPAPPDVVTLCIGRKHVMTTMEMAAEAGARAAVIYDGGFAEAGAEGSSDQRRLVDLCRAADISLCGPNCMGVLNPSHRSTTFLQPVRDVAALQGSVGLLAQSGSICGSMLADVRRFGFSLVVSSGNEAVVPAAAYIEAMVDDPATRVIAAFIESVREPQRFVAALDRAAAAGKPVVVLKVGRSQRARAAIQSHTGGLAGESRVFSEVLRTHRAIEVSNLEDFTEVLAALQANKHPAGTRTQIVTTSGGQSELIIDLADAAGHHLPPLPQPLCRQIGTMLESEVVDANPLDAWGAGDAGASIPAILDLIIDSKAADAILFCSGDSMDNQPLGRPGRELGYAQMLAEKAPSSPIPLFLLSTRPGVLHSGQVEVLRKAGAALLCGPRQALTALSKIAAWTSYVEKPRPPAPMPVIEWPSARAVLNEFDAKRLLARASIPTVNEELVRDLPGALSAADRIGYPVVLKVAADDIPHKTDVGLVALDLRTPDDLTRAFTSLQAKLIDIPATIDGYVVQSFVSRGIEFFAGVIDDPSFGLLLVCGRGGIDVERESDVAFRRLPLAQGDAEGMISELRAAHLLEPSRGRPAGDAAALARCLYAIADFAVTQRAHFTEIDINPIKVLSEGEGCIVVDAMIVSRT